MAGVLTLNPFRPMGILKYLFILAITIVYVLSSHAMDKHSASSAVDDCVQSGGTIMNWEKPGKRTMLCVIVDGKFGVKVNELNGDNVTAFVKDKMKTAEQFVKYLLNRGGWPTTAKTMEWILRNCNSRENVMLAWSRAWENISDPATKEAMKQIVFELWRWK